MPKSNSIQNNQGMILWPLFGSLDQEFWVFDDLMRLSSVAFIKQWDRY